MLTSPSGLHVLGDCFLKMKMKELTSQELKAHPTKGYYRWKYGKDTTYHCGLARVYCERGHWFCDTL
jgi:hypothetical protein